MILVIGIFNFEIDDQGRRGKGSPVIFGAFGIGTFALLLFPVYPSLLVSIPLLLAVAGIISRSKYEYDLLLMIVLAIVANGLLLKWELDFYRSIPIIQLFESKKITAAVFLVF